MGNSVRSRGRSTQEELTILGYSRLREELMKWYSTQSGRFSRLSTFTSKELGSLHDMAVKTKAAETRPLVQFCDHTLGRCADRLPPKAACVVAATKELSNFVTIL